MTYSEDVYDLNKEQLEAIGEAKPASKYHNAQTEAAGMTFQSGHEAAGVAGLLLAEKQGHIFGLRLQVRFPLAGKVVYVADAVYLEKVGGVLYPRVVDFKGFKTQAYKIKRKLFKERYGQDIEEL